MHATWSGRSGEECSSLGASDWDMSGSHVSEPRGWETDAMATASQTPSSDESLGHIVVVGGTTDEWLSFTDSQWERRFRDLVRGISPSGAQWITLMPFSGRMPNSMELKRLRNALVDRTPCCVSATHPTRFECVDVTGINVVIESNPDGHMRFANDVEALRLAGFTEATLTAQVLARQVLSPSGIEPDLVVVLGPPDHLPQSLVWELGYSELVFLDLKWSALEASHLEVAVEDFHRRHRRFGGLDS